MRDVDIKNTPGKWDIALEKLVEGLREDWEATQAEFKELMDLISPPNEALEKFVEEFYEANRRLMDISSELMREIDLRIDPTTQRPEYSGPIEEAYKNKSGIPESIDWEVNKDLPELPEEDIFGENIENDIVKVEDLGGALEKLKQVFNEEWVSETMSGASGVFADGLADCLKDFDHFGDGLKSLGDELKDYLIKAAVDALMEVVMQSKLAEGLLKGSSLPVNTLVRTGKTIGGSILSIFGLGKHHSGGAILPSASGMLPGTQEQIAMLKGGERVLSPSEASSYNEDSFSGGGQPVVFLNNNIKAWDSKDVKQYLIDNASLLQSITAQGIRDNKHYLRTMIRNA